MAWTGVSDTTDPSWGGVSDTTDPNWTASTDTWAGWRILSVDSNIESEYSREGVDFRYAVKELGAMRVFSDWRKWPVFDSQLSEVP